MSLFISAFIFASLLCFIVMTAYKARKYSRFPIHSRLELYPVPKEGSKRAGYGGSYLEEPKWWDKSRVIDRATEQKDILKEMLFIQKLFKNNRGLWWMSYSFHLGIYLLFAWTILLLPVGILKPATLNLFATAVGTSGFALATLGAAILLLRRICDRTLRAYTTLQEYFNLGLILCVLVTGIVSWTTLSSPYAVAEGMLHFSSQALPPFVNFHLILLGLMLIYIPASKMSHYVGKFFAFHKVLWDNDPVFQGNDVDERLRQASSRTPQQCWSAPHINPNDEVGQ